MSIMDEKIEKHRKDLEKCQEGSDEYLITNTSIDALKLLKRFIEDFEKVSQTYFETCPVCGSEDIETKEESREDGKLYKKRECQVCLQNWYEVWQLDKNDNELGDFLYNIKEL